MKYKDDELLKEAYSSIIKEDINDNFFAKNIDVTINHESSDIYIDDSSAKTEVLYSIEIEYRSWGIKGIYAHVKKVLPVGVYITNETTGEETYVSIDPAEGEIESAPTNRSYCNDDVVSPQTITIDLDSNYKPIKTVVEF